ncbi:PAS domain S-box protein [Algoriphagus aquimarinus]|nr:PAS domain S-box protein [Algoriphagus aquimarinus]
MINLDFQLIYANKAYLDSTKKVTGEQRKLNESIFDESDNEVEIKKWKAHYSRAFKGDHFEIEEHFTDQDSNNTQYSQITFEPLLGDDGEVFAASCQSKDISHIINQRSEAKQLIDSSLDVFCTINEKGDFVYVSAASISLWGYSPEELVGKSYLGFVLEEDVAKTKEVAKTILSGKDTRSFTNRYRKKDGGISYNLWSVRWDNRTRLHYSVARDGWEKIEQEEELLRSEQRFKALVQEGYDLYAIIDLQGRYIYMSPSSTAIIGIPPEAFIGRDAFEFIHPEDMEKTRSNLKKVRTEGKVVMENYRAKNQNDEWRWVETVLTNMLDNPAVNGIVINSRDITDKIEQEEKILLSQKRFESLVENGLDCVIIISPEGNTTYVSGSVKKVLGYSPADVMDIDFRELVHPEDIAGSENALLLSINNPGVPMKGYTSRVKHKNGSWRWIEPVITNLLHDPSVMGIVDNFRDITEQVQEQERLKLLESVITNTKDAVLITEAEPYDEPGPKIIYVNEAFTKMTGYEAEEVIGKSPRILQGPNSNKEDLAKLGSALRNWEPHETTILNYKKNGEEFWTNFTVTPVANEKGWYTHWVAIERDVTEQKNREIEKNLINTISDIFHQSIDNDLTLCLSNLCEHITQVGDFDIAEVWLPSIDDKSINRVAHYEKGKAGDVFFKLTKQITSCALGQGLPGYVWKNKKTEVWENVEGKWLAQRKLAAKKAGFEVMMGVPLKHKDEVIGVLLLGTIRTKSALTQYVDLLKKLELAIGSELSRKKIEIELAQIFDFTPDLICMAGFDGHIKRINPAGLALLGYSLEEMRSKPISSFLYEQDRFLTQEHQRKLHSGERLNNFENRYVTKEGKIIWLSWTATPSPDHEIVYAVAKDITEEKKLRELNRQVGELAKIGSWEVDLGKQSVFWSEEVHRLHETDPNSFVPSFEGSINFYRSDFHDMVRSTIEKCIATGKPYYIEAVLVTANQKETWVRGTGSAEFIDGKCTRIFGSIQDIDDTKQSQIRLQSLASNLPGVIYQYIIKPDGTDSLKNVSEGSGPVWGFASEAVIDNIQLAWDNIKAGGDLEKVKKSLSHAIEFKTNWTCRYKYMMPSGELRTHLGIGTPTFLSDGTVLFNSIDLDITQEVKNEELLKEITDIARIGSWEMDLINQDGEYVYWSPILREIVEVDDSYDTTLTGGIEFHIGESKERIKKALELLITEGIEFDEEILLCTAKGNERWNRCIGKSEMVNGKRIRVYGSYQDIHERKIAEIAVRESEAKFRTIFEIASLGIAQVNPTNGRIILANSYYETITGYTVKELLKIDFPKLTHPDDREKDWELFSKAAHGEEEYSNEKRYVRKDGSIVWVRIHLAFIRDETGKPIRTVAICEDISERKKAEQEKSSLQETIENSLNEIYIFDVDTHQFNYVNQGALLNLGYSKQEIKTLTPLDLKPDYTETSFNQLIAPLKSNEKEKIVFFTNHKRKDGSLYPVEVHLQLVSDGNTKRFLAIILDITERRKAEEENRFKANLLSTIGQAAIATNLDGIVNYWNKAAENIYGWKREEALGRHIMDLTTPDANKEEAQDIMEVLKNGQIWLGEFNVRKKDGTSFPAMISNSPTYNEQNILSGMIGISSDISEKVKNELLLKQYTLELERSNEELEQFAYVASHDLQEPLRMVSSFMDLLKLKYGHKLDEKGLQYIYFATDGAKRMKKIILDLLDYSRATKHTDGIEVVNFNDVLSEFEQLRRKLIVEKSAVIKSNNLPTLTTYKVASVQIIHCLLDNALKYSIDDTPPIIEIIAMENETEWAFSITDNGIGIDPQFHEKIFIIFQRLHNKDKYTGTGIGLSIAKRQVEFLGGKIWLESVPGEGTVFYFTIPKTK